MKTKRVMLAMSGGVDSSVSAIFLKQKGYEVIGVTMLLHDENSNGMQAIKDASEAARIIGIEHRVIDFKTEFKNVINYFIDSYLDAITPNPCVYCNMHIKFGKLLGTAKELDCDFLATGHYARIAHENNRYFIKKANDKTKDQSYFLWHLPQEKLKQILFPLGEYEKTDVKRIAKENNLFHISNKRESYDICFIEDDYQSFLKRKLNQRNISIPKGNIYTANGKYISQHEGYPFYTIGQTKNLNINTKESYSIAEIHKKTNTLIVGNPENITIKGLKINQINSMKYSFFPEEKEFSVQLRYRNENHQCIVKQNGEVATIVFRKPILQATPGQSVVLYENDDIVGGGILTKI